MFNSGDTTQHTRITALGRYQIVKRIGRGGMGDVWLAEDPRLHRQVAIKTLPTHSQSDREFSLRFEREAQATAALNHPHILPIHDYGEQFLPNGEVITYIVMPYIAGGSLEEQIHQYASRERLMPPQEALAYLLQAAEAIDYAHIQGIVHRDIKPGNMLLRSDNWLLLADFGIARMLSTAEKLTQMGVGFGTPDYMAPEQAQGNAEAASDNYSLAVIAYQLFAGRVPFRADTGYATTMQHITLPPPAPTQFNRAINPALQQALLLGLAKQPGARPPTARAFVTSLQQALMNAPFEETFRPPQQEVLPTTQGTAPRERNTQEAGTLESAKEQRRSIPLSRRRLLIGGGVALVAVGGGLSTWALVHELNTSTSGTTGRNTTPRPITTSAPASDPNAPAFTLQGPHIKQVDALAWSPKADVFATASDNDVLVLWDMGQLQQSGASTQAKAQQKVDGFEMQLAWSPDGSKLAVANSGKEPLFSSDETIDIYLGDLSQLAPGFATPTTASNTSFIQGLGWVHENVLVAVSSRYLSNDTDHFELWAMDITRPQQKLTSTLVAGSLAGSSTTVGYPPLLAIASDQATVAIGLINGLAIGQVKLVGRMPQWQPSSANLQFASVYAPEAYAVTWAPGKTIVGSFYTLNGSTLYFWNWQNSSKNPEQTIQTDAKLTTMAWCPAPTSPLFAAGTQDGKVLIWNFTKNDQPVGTLNSGGINAEILTLAWSTNGNWLAASLKDNAASVLVWKIQGRGF